MPRNCSSGRESRYLILPASLGEMMPLVAMRASVREVLPWSCLVSPDAAAAARRTHHMGHDANVAHIVGCLLYQLLGRDHRHRGRWCVVVCVCVCAVSRCRSARRWCRWVAERCNPVSRRGRVSTGIKGPWASSGGIAGSGLRQWARLYSASSGCGRKCLKLSGDGGTGTPLPFAAQKKASASPMWRLVLDSTPVARPHHPAS
jgi:hypothetical protein